MQQSQLSYKDLYDSLIETYHPNGSHKPRIFRKYRAYRASFVKDGRTMNAVFNREWRLQ